MLYLSHDAGFSLRCRRIASNGAVTAWRRRGGHYRLLEPQTVDSLRNVIKITPPLEPT